MDKQPHTLTNIEIEAIEKMSLRATTQAVLNFAANAWDEFQKSPDDADGVAEDVTQEALTDLSGFSIKQRLYGTVDYRQARYVFLPQYQIRQALFVDSKAEKAPQVDGFRFRKLHCVCYLPEVMERLSIHQEDYHP